MICEVRTDVGKTRAINEDSILIDKERGIFLLADGMGGHEAGEVASKLAVDSAYTYLCDHLAGIGSDGDKILHVLEEAFQAAHREVKERAYDSLQLKGMGTTLLATVVDGNKAYVCSVGDSRLYLIRRSISQLTVDDTLGSVLFHSKNMSAEKIPEMYWNILTQAVGGENQIVPSSKTFRFFPEDILILCSDGLYGMVSDDEIQTIVNNKDFELGRISDLLMHKALENGGIDNISFILLKHE